MPALTSVGDYVIAGRIAFGAMTGAYQTLLAGNSASNRKLYITNSLDTETVLSLDGGTTDFLYLPAYQGIVIDFDTSMHWAGTVSVKHNGAPTAGAISAGILAGR